MFTRSFLFAAVLALLSSFHLASALAADGEAAPEVSVDAGPQTFSIVFENDLFGDTDAQYTNGTQVSWVSPNLKALGGQPGVPGFLLRAIRRLDAFEHAVLGENDRQFNVGFAVGQLMFTPDDTQARTVVRDDRPYAGFLYGTLSLVSKGVDIADTLDIQLGMVGPASLAEDSQRLIHELRGFDVPQGWNHQLGNEPGALVYYERKWRVLHDDLFARFGYDVIAHGGVALGNVAVYGAAGGEVRFGWNLPHDFGTAQIRPGGDTNAPSSIRAADGTGRGLGVYLTAAIGGRLVAHDIFLDGNTFEHSHSVDKEPAVGDLVLGGSVVYSSLKLSYQQVFRSREFERQKHPHNFGSLSLSVSF